MIWIQYWAFSTDDKLIEARGSDSIVQVESDTPLSKCHEVAREENDKRHKHFIAYQIWLGVLDSKIPLTPIVSVYTVPV